MKTPPLAFIDADLAARFRAGEARRISPPKGGLSDPRECLVLTRPYGRILGVLVADAPPPAPALIGAAEATLDYIWKTALGRIPPEELRLVVALGVTTFSAVDLRICPSSGSLVATRWRSLFATEHAPEIPHV